MKLELMNVSKFYGDVHALNGFTYTFEPGVYGILGANGAGKSTLFNLLTDNVKREDGTIKYDDADILEIREAYRKVIGYMPQQQGYYEKMNALSYLKYIAYLKGMNSKVAKAQIKENLTTMNLWESRYRRVGGFSGGMKQRLIIAATLLDDPKILILDEPTAGLDPKERISIRNYISAISKNKIILLATHIVSDVECIADKVIIMRKGNIIAHGSPTELIYGVEGKIGEIDCDREEIIELQKKYPRCNILQHGNGLVLRIASDELPEDARKVNEGISLEDVYLYYENREE